MDHVGEVEKDVWVIVAMVGLQGAGVHRLHAGQPVLQEDVHILVEGIHLGRINQCNRGRAHIAVFLSLIVAIIGLAGLHQSILSTEQKRQHLGIGNARNVVLGFGKYYRGRPDEVLALVA